LTCALSGSSVRSAALRRTGLTLGLAALLTVALAGCGGGGDSRSSGSPTPTASGKRAAAAKTAAAPADKPYVAPTGSYRGTVPILMYHVIDAVPAGTPYPGLFVTPRLFNTQMRTLKREGYTAITQEQMWKAWHGGPGMPAKPFIASFDDGYQGQATHAAVILHALGWPGVLNLEVHNLTIDGGLNATEVKKMISYGWEIDAHTLTHPDLTTVDATRLKTEIAGSRRALQKKFGGTVPFFCYPAGRYNDAVVTAVKAAGYTGATTEISGVASRTDDPFLLPRIRVNGGESASAVVTSLTGNAPAAPSGSD
jgi:peptidoglycan/xylan/chitin deacetylase (PgdA/CDA1 family)